ncbi:MAG: P-type conjugative transfer protein VirB9 [Candidatus Cloacimonetes bacterium]|nr:P-type conjugative transfer protein VirB9 [Candidatus Cloacimonadota bacterium]
MKRLILAAIFSIISSAGFALDLPKGSSYDPRIQYVDYNEQDVVEVNGYPGIATQITFGSGEEVLDIASGFSQGWEFANRRNYLYLKPKSVKLQDNTIMEPASGKWDTNLIVTTSQRVYTFHLVLHRGREDKKLAYNPKVAFRVAFRYPIDEAEKAKAAAEKQAAQARLENKPAPRNLSYSMQIGEGSDEIAPTMAYDDGRFTYLRFPGNHEFPAVFVVSRDKTESLVNTHIDPKAPDVLVVHRVSRELVLRLGNSVVGIYNDAFDSIGLPPKDGTTIPGVRRTVKSESGEPETNPVINYSPVTGATIHGMPDPRAPYLPAGWTPNASKENNSEELK